MVALANLLAGLVFGLGLVVSGMTDPARILAFLDIFGAWDPSLAFVMGGAVVTTFVGYRLVLRRPRPMLDDRFHLPLRHAIDRPVVIGPALFGIGWGLGGFCPGPALAAIGLAAPGTLAFVPAMLAGMWMARLVKAGKWGRRRG